MITPFFNLPVAQTIASYVPPPPLPEEWEKFFAVENAEAQRRLDWDVDEQMDWEYDPYPAYEEEMFEAQEPEPPVSLAEYMLIMSDFYN